MRRTIALACALTVLVLPACQSDRQPAPAPAPAAAPIATGNLCERMLPKLTGKWKVADADPTAGVPLLDSCQLIDTDAPQHMVRVSLSILPVTAADAVRARKRTEQNFREDNVAAKVMDGDLGEGSWTLDPVAAAPQLGFRSGDRLIRLRGDSDVGSAYRSDRSTLAELRAMAKIIVELPNGLPPRNPVANAPHCAPGLAAAQKVLGAKAIIRRGGTVGGLTYCIWGSASQSVMVRAGDSTSDPAFLFQTYPDSLGSTAVRVGDQGWQETTNGALTFRVASTYVNVSTTRIGQEATVLELGRAMVPTYRR